MELGNMRKTIVLLVTAFLLIGCGTAGKKDNASYSPVKAPTSGCQPYPAQCGTEIDWSAGIAAYEAQIAAFYQSLLKAEMATTRGGGGGRCGDDWECFAACTRAHESDRGDASGNGRHDQGYGAVDPSGKYRGAYQFNAGTWEGAASRAGYPVYANTPADQVPSEVQDAAAKQLWSERGNQPWGGRC